MYSSILSSMIPKFPLSFNMVGIMLYKSPINIIKNITIINNELFLEDKLNFLLK